MRRIADTLAELRKTTDQHRWFLVEYGAGPKPELPSAKDFHRYPGLVMLCLLDGSDRQAGTRVGTFWASKQDFQASRRELEGVIGTDDVERYGFVRDLRTPRQSLYKRLPALIVSLVAILGALDALQNHYSRLLETPRLSLDLGGTEAWKQLDTAPLALDLAVANGSLREAAAVRLDTIQILGQGPAPQPPRLERPNLQVSIPAGGRGTLTIRSATLPPGSYRLTATVSAKVGELRGWHSSSAPRDLAIWAEQPQVAVPLVLEQTGAHNAWLSGTLRVGRETPRGLDCAAVVTHVAQLEIIGVQEFTSASAPSLVAEPGREMASVHWSTGPLPAFSARPFRIRLAGHEKTAWAKVTASTRVYCSDHVDQEKTK